MTLEQSKRRHARTRNRHRWEKTLGDRLTLAALALLLMLLAAMPFLWGGRHALAVGVLGAAVLLALLLWLAGGAARGRMCLQPAWGALPLLLLLLLGALQQSPWCSQLLMSEQLAWYWELVRAAHASMMEPVLAVLPGTHRDFMLVCGAAALFYMLAAQLMGGSRKKLIVLSMTVAATAALCGLAALVQHFGGYDWLFWVYKGKTASLSGPYFNKNHFAQLQSLGLFTALGMLLAVWNAPRGSLMAGIAHYGGRRTHVVLWGGCALICLTGLLLSLSRAGILCATAALAAYVLCLLCGRRGIRLSVPMLLVLAALLLASFYGLDRIMSRLELALSGEDASGLVRWELWRTMKDVIALSPWWGTGFGSVRALAPLFDLGYIPGFLTFDAHNDYLELATACGLPVACLLIACCIVLLLRTGYRLTGDSVRRSSLYPLLAGIFFGLLAGAGHEVVDYGLKQPANLLVFLSCILVLAGLLRHVEHPLESVRPWRPGRALYALPALCLLPVLCLAGIYGSRMMSGLEVMRLHALQDVAEMRKALRPAVRMPLIVRQSARVLERDACDLDALRAAGNAHVLLAELKQSSLLARQVAGILDRPVSCEQVWRPQYQPYWEEAFRTLAPQERAQVAEEYASAEEAYRRLLQANPMNGAAVSALAQAYDNSAAWHGRRETALAMHKLAVSLYPTNSDVLRRAIDGYWRAWQEEQGTAAKGELMAAMLELAWSYGALMPQRMGAVYPKVWRMLPDAALLVNMTSDTIQGQESLASFFMSQGLWAEAWAAWRRMEQLNEARPVPETPETLGNIGFLRRERRDRNKLAQFIVKQQLIVAGELEDTASIAELEARLAALVYAEHTPRIARADELMRQGEHLLAEEVLRSMPYDGRALVRYAEILLNAGRLEQLRRTMASIGELEASLEEDAQRRLKRLRQQCQERGIDVPESSD